ncbi:MAG: undecaprenyl-diphosphatase [Candidatus Marinimicrobia bacterium]|mgnify:CR=1 FL=1|nr:undecaprenyl-diphosphatase [Candidatus Neomarinimicrobiota bacterium]|tara:strand:+ start:935 stop:1705 length:771 start_codon:yes stop_codon:yes gene_type:complete
MGYIDLIILGVIQGLTEFLPVSSSGHLVFIQHFLKIESPGTSLEVILHLGTLCSIIFFYNKELSSLLSQIISFEIEALKYIFYILFGIIPAAIAGVFFKDFFTSFFNNLYFTSYFLIFTGFILFCSKFMEHKMNSLSLKNTFMVGLIQAFSIFPGISRSGMTISVAMFLGLEKKEAFKLSFFLAIPIIIGATILEIPHLMSMDNSSIFPLIIGFFVSACSGYIALKSLYKIVIKNKFWIFSLYCFIIGIIGVFYAR